MTHEGNRMASNLEAKLASVDSIPRLGPIQRVVPKRDSAGNMVELRPVGRLQVGMFSFARLSVSMSVCKWPMIVPQGKEVTVHFAYAYSTNLDIIPHLLDKELWGPQ